MAEHAWSVLCTKSVVDKQSNNISLFDVIEQIRVKPPESSVYEEGSVVLVPFNFALVSLWIRSDPSKPEKFRARINLKTPVAEIVGFEEEIDLTKHRRARSISNFQDFPVSGPGQYFYKVNIEIIKGKKASWKNVANIPVEIIFE